MGLSLNLQQIMSHEAHNSPAERVRLSDLTSGEKGRVCDLQGEANVCARLREMGFCEESIVERVSGNSTLLCQVCGTKIALNGRAAQHIVVEKLPS
jgi:ferrous iron transport protein A